MHMLAVEINCVLKIHCITLYHYCIALYHTLYYISNTSLYDTLYYILKGWFTAVEDLKRGFDF